MNATDLIAWVPLQDNEGHTHGRYCPQHNIVVIKRRGVEHRFQLTELATKANVQGKTSTCQTVRKVLK